MPRWRGTGVIETGVTTATTATIIDGSRHLGGEQQGVAIFETLLASNA